MILLKSFIILPQELTFVCLFFCWVWILGCVWFMCVVRTKFYFLFFFLWRLRGYLEGALTGSYELKRTSWQSNNLFSLVIVRTLQTLWHVKAFHRSAGFVLSREEDNGFTRVVFWVFTGKSERTSFIGYERDPVTSGCQVRFLFCFVFFMKTH